jgi:hypothetical protein
MPYLLLMLLCASIATVHSVEPARDTSRIPGTLPPEVISPLLDSPEPYPSADTDPIAGRRNRFTPKQKATLKERNAAANEGKVICENCKTETVPAEKHEKNVTPPKNEAHTDHPRQWSDPL